MHSFTLDLSAVEANNCDTSDNMSNRHFMDDIAATSNEPLLIASILKILYFHFNMLKANGETIPSSLGGQ